MEHSGDTFHDALTAALDGEDDGPLKAVLSAARAADIAESFRLLRDEQRSRIIFALPSATAAEVVILLDEAVRGDVVEELDAESLTEIVSALPPDDAADVLGELSEQEAERILDQMGDEQSDRIEELLEYDAWSAGGIMTPDVVAVLGSKTVADALERIRQTGAEEDLNEIYVVDADRKLIGTVSLRKLVTSPPTAALAAICHRDPVVVHVNEKQETVVQIIRKYGAMEAAVVDDERRLIGRITHDDLLDVAEEEAEEDLLRMAGTDAAELETSSVFHAARIRLTWLLPSMLGMLLSASVLAISKPRFDMALFGTLALFVPMIGATGGNSGIQISTIIVRGFASGELASTKLLQAMLREGRIALTMAPVCGLAAWGVSFASLPLLESFEPDSAARILPTKVALSVGLSMTCAILVAAFLGIALPFTFRRLGVDPAIASGPLVTTMNDVLSVSIYMTAAMLIVR